jgi:hypothetical protein
MAAACEALALADTPSQQIESSRWTPFRTALCLTAGLRIFYSLVAAVLSSSLTLDPNRIATNFTENLIQRDTHPWQYALIGVWQRFDTIYYVHIAHCGYDTAAATVFYPLYPVLIRLLSPVTRSDLVTAVLISTIATFFLVWGALSLFELDLSHRSALRAVLCWLAWPSAFIFFAGYPESMLMALTIWGLYFARKQRWGLAAGAAFLAGLTKAFGCFSALPLLCIGWKQRDRQSLFAAIAAGAATFGYQLWLRLSGFPSPSDIYLMHWHTTTVAPWAMVIEALQSISHRFDLVLFLNFSALACAGLICLVRRLPFEYRIYSLAAILLFLTKRTDHRLLQSSMRYSLCAFAVYPMISKWLTGNLRFTVAMLLMMALNLVVFHVYLEWGLII